MSHASAVRPGRVAQSSDDLAAGSTPACDDNMMRKYLEPGGPA
jgi:hypothetical protein